jgi:hypothetical protein
LIITTKQLQLRRRWRRKHGRQPSVRRRKWRQRLRRPECGLNEWPYVGVGVVGVEVRVEHEVEHEVEVEVEVKEGKWMQQL